MKRVPRDCVPFLSAIQVFAESRIPNPVNKTIRGAIVGIILATVVEDQAFAGNIPLSNWNRAYIRKLSQNCVRIAGGIPAVAITILQQLQQFDENLSGSEGASTQTNRH